jgi:hypothetical protein
MQHLRPLFISLTLSSRVIQNKMLTFADVNDKDKKKMAQTILNPEAKAWRFRDFL